MTLGELRPGALFRTEDGRVGVRWEAESRQDRRTGCLWLDGHGFKAAPPADTPVEPLDLPALLAERDELLGLVHDLLIDSEAERRGREAERGEAVRLLEGKADQARTRRGRAWQENDHHVARDMLHEEEFLRGLVAAVRARGPAAAPDPPARLAARVRELEGALTRVVEQADAYEQYGHGQDPGAVLDAIAAARAALEGAGGKQPT